MELGDGERGLTSALTALQSASTVARTGAVDILGCGVAGEGVAGVILYIVLLPILQLIPCDDERMCTNGVISDSI